MSLEGISTSGDFGRINPEEAPRFLTIICPAMKTTYPTMEEKQCLQRYKIRNPCIYNCKELNKLLVKHKLPILEQPIKPNSQLCPSNITICECGFGFMKTETRDKCPACMLIDLPIPENPKDQALRIAEIKKIQRKQQIKRIRK